MTTPYRYPRFQVYRYPISQEEMILSEQEEMLIDPLELRWWAYGGPMADVRRNGAICPICQAIMDNPLTWMTFDYCPVYQLVCPVCSYEDTIQ